MTTVVVNDGSFIIEKLLKPIEFDGMKCRYKCYRVGDAEQLFGYHMSPYGAYQEYIARLEEHLKKDQEPSLLVKTVAWFIRRKKEKDATS